jgi:hypothetical protein
MKEMAVKILETWMNGDSVALRMKCGDVIYVSPTGEIQEKNKEGEIVGRFKGKVSIDVNGVCTLVSPAGYSEPHSRVYPFQSIEEVVVMLGLPWYENSL